jgi:hypothetical protein
MPRLSVHGATACLERFDLFTVMGAYTYRGETDTCSLKGRVSARDLRLTPQAHTPQPPTPNFNYELFNHNNFKVRYLSWNYRGCWHQTCPQVVFAERFRLRSSRCARLESARSSCHVAASRCPHWAICAPAASLGSGRHLSGALSGIEP